MNLRCCSSYRGGTDEENPDFMDLEPKERLNLAVASGRDKGHLRDCAISTTLSRLGDFSIW